MSTSSKPKTMPAKEREALLAALEQRFAHHQARHPGMAWTEVAARLAAAPDKLWSIGQLEATGGEPDVVGRDAATGELLFCDCSPESPKGRRSVCYDGAALAARKEHKPANSAIDLATAMGGRLLSESEYRSLQELGGFDTKTSSWIETPSDVRKLGGALFGDRRYGRVFIYHNGAESYYAVRGFRAIVAV